MVRRRIGLALVVSQQVEVISAQSKTMNTRRSGRGPSRASPLPARHRGQGRATLKMARPLTKGLGGRRIASPICDIRSDFKGEYQVINIIELLGQGERPLAQGGRLLNMAGCLRRSLVARAIKIEHRKVC